MERRRKATGPNVLVAHPGAELYGSDRMAIESVAGLIEAGARVTVILPHDGPLVEALVRTGAQVEILPNPVLRKEILRPAGFIRFVRDSAVAVPRIVGSIRRFGRDGVYVSTITIPLWVVIGRLLGVRTTCHVHEAEGTARRLVRWLLALPVVAAHRVIANSEFATEVLCSAHPRLRSRVIVVANGVAGPPVVQPARATLTAPVSILFVGRLSPRKGPQVAIDALRILSDRHPGARLVLLGSVFAGYEWFEAELRETVRRSDLVDRVDFAGFHPDVWSVLAAADIAVVPSVQDEPFGNTAVEAVLAARPVVVSDTSGLREASAGFTSAVRVPPGAAEPLARALGRMIEDWDAMSVAARADSATAAERHSPARYRRRVASTVLGASRDVVERQ